MPTESVVHTLTQCLLKLKEFSPTQNTTKFIIGRCSHRHTAKKVITSVVFSQTDAPTKFFRKVFSLTTYKMFPLSDNPTFLNGSVPTKRLKKVLLESVPTDRQTNKAF